MITPLGHTDSCCYNFVLKKEEIWLVRWLNEQNILVAKPDKMTLILMAKTKSHSHPLILTLSKQNKIICKKKLNIHKHLWKKNTFENNNDAKLKTIMLKEKILMT